MNSTPLLSIAIPTWNRAQILKVCLERLIPQIYEYRDQIQFVISDNFSDDDTQFVINEALKNYLELNFVSFKQSENTGYFGNFKKCRELSNAKYFWLLSDNDFVEPGLICFLISILKTDSPGLIFLKDWTAFNKNNSLNSEFSVEKYNTFSFFELYGDRSTLISSVIFPNVKQHDDELYLNLKNNTFIGFFLFLSSIDIEQKAYVISGKALSMYSTKVSFNVFKSFGDDLTSGIHFLELTYNFPKVLSNSIVNLCIENISSRHYIIYRIFGKVHNINPGSKLELEKFLYIKFSHYSSFETHYLPLFEKNLIQLWFLFIQRKVVPYIKKKFQFSL